MKKYFYYTFEFKRCTARYPDYSGNGICESSDDGLFPLYKALNDSTYKVKSDPTFDYDRDYMAETIFFVTNIVEISKGDFLIFNYDEVNGNDREK